MSILSEIKECIKEGKLEIAIRLINDELSSHATTQSQLERSDLYYLLGNAYRKTGEFHLAMYNYTKAIDSNPASPAMEARNALIDIMNFYNKDMYNQ